MSETESKLDKWVNHLSQRELPIFKYSLIAITTITAREDSSSSELASAILKDINLTARILRISNSYIYNPSNTRVNTITHAVMLLGFNLVRDLSISLALIDTLLTGDREEHVMKLMARTFHAAVQAREIASLCEDESPEEIFIATLLYNIGELTFCCVNSHAAEKLMTSRLLSTDQNYEKMQTQVLGFTFKQLTERLTQDWQLSNLLRDTLHEETNKDNRCQHILRGNAIALAAEHGWQSPETDKEITKLSKHINKDFKKTTQFIHENVEDAVHVAEEFGARDAAKYIPSLTTQSAKQNLPEELEEQGQYLSPDHMLQLSILRELSSMLNKKPALNNILTMVLEGIYRGIGMDRTSLVFIDPTRTSARAKTTVGIDSQTFQKNFNVEIDMTTPNLLQQVLIYNRSYWVKDDAEGKQLVNQSLRNVVKAKTFFIAPITVDDSTLGVFYADRFPSGRPLDAESYQSFQHFAQEACIALKFIKNNK